jgi:hypothetical protein
MISHEAFCILNRSDRDADADVKSYNDIWNLQDPAGSSFCLRNAALPLRRLERPEEIAHRTNYSSFIVWDVLVVVQNT